MMQYWTDTNNPHLGGDIVGGDPRTWCPEVWKVLITPPPISIVFSVMDVGCGGGESTRWFADNGCNAIGIDGLPRSDPRIMVHDYTTGPLRFQNKFDLAWCCEFVEHVEEQFVSNFMASLMRAKRVAITAATPGQTGYHHVNCRIPEYWKGVFAGYSFTYNAQLTEETKLLAPNTFWQKNGMIFDTNVS
jgi:hypothetical protein